jgi:glycosyltransferase involved in cell wall biosynthesis
MKGVDLVHVLYGGVLAFLSGQEVAGRTPLVVSFCGSDLLGEPLGGMSRRMLAGFGAWCSRRAAQNADGIIVKAPNLLAALPQGLDPAKVAVIPNGVDLERFRPLDRRSCLSQLGWSEEGVHVLFPANAGDPVKRFPLAQAAVAELSGFGVLVELHRLERVPHEQVPVWLNAANALLLTSDHEGSPNIVKEAMACNLPVVSVDVGDVRERISPVTGCRICESDPRSLAQGLLSVVAPDVRSDGRLFMGDVSLEKVASRVRVFYERILGRWLDLSSGRRASNWT